MKTHYTAKELAGLPGMPGHVSNVIKQADRENWPWQKRAGRGGGREYSLEALPEATRLYLTARNQVPAVRQAAVPAVTIATTAAAPTSATLADYQRRCMDARLVLLTIVRSNAPSKGVKGAINQLIKAVNEFDAVLPTHVLDAVPLANARAGKSGERTLSLRTVLRWWSDWKKSGFQAMSLAPETLKDSKSGQIVAVRRPKFDPAWAEDFMKHWSKPQKPELTDVLRTMKDVMPAGAMIPSYDQARRYLKSLGLLEASRGRMTGNELRSLMPYRRRLTDHMYPGDCYTADGHTFDAEVAHPFHGRPFRAEVTPVIDIATRYVVGWSCDLSESGLAVLDALRIACEAFGPPVIFYTDNGPGYKNQLMTAPGTGILHRLGITPEYSRPRNPQAHGISERAHRTILVKAAKSLCTYMGASMDQDAKQLAYKETRKAAKKGEISPIMLEWDEFVAHINRAIEEYHHRPHRGLPAYRDPVTRKRIHMTPAQAMELGLRRMYADLPEEYRLAPANELPDLYHPAKECTVNRGCVTLGRKIYGSPDLVNYTKERVQVAYSPSDPSRVWVRNLESGSLIATAVLNHNADGYFAQSYIEEKRGKRADMKIKRLENHLREAELERKGPAQVIVQHAPEIQEARRQLEREMAQDAEIVPPTRTAEAKLLPPEKPAVTTNNITTLPDADFVLPADARGKWQFWVQIDGLIQAGEEVSERRYKFWQGWQKTADWRAFYDLAEHRRQADAEAAKRIKPVK